MDECDNYVNPKGFCISHTPPSAYDQQGKDELKWSRMFAPIDAVASTDNVNGGVSSVNNLMTPQATGSNRKHQHRDDINRDRRNPRLGEGHVNMPLWQQTPQATGSNRKHQHRDDINRDRRNPRLGEGHVNMPLWQQAAASPEGTVLSDQWHRICNSTSSVFVSSTISTPSASELVLCVSSVIKIQMDHDMCKPEAVREQFPYFKLDSSSTPNTNTDVPSLEAINTFVHDMFFAGGFSAECNIIALVYINRVISSTGLPILQNNWQGIVCAAYLLAQKVWDDNSLNVKSFATIFPIFTLEQVRQYEKDFINLLDYQAMVSSQIYTRYYFELRELFDELQRGSTGDDGHDNFPLKPLELWRAKDCNLLVLPSKCKNEWLGALFLRRKEKSQ